MSIKRDGARKNWTSWADRIMAYEEGGLSAGDTVRLFSDLIQSGQINHLQGHYWRVAAALVENNVLSHDGYILVPDLWDNDEGTTS